MTMVALLLPAMGAFAASEDAENQALRDAFDAAFPPGKPICFMRAYDRAHLDKHRTLTLRTIAIGHGSADIKRERAWDREQELWKKRDAAAGSTVSRYIRVTAEFRNDRRLYSDSVVCGGTSEARISCRTDGCDTANQRIYIRADGPRHILAWPDGVRLRGTCGDDAPSRSLTASDHDGPIRLELAPMSACLRK